MSLEKRIRPTSLNWGFTAVEMYWCIYHEFSRRCTGLKFDGPLFCISPLRQSYGIEYTVEQACAVRALSFGLLRWQYGSGSFAEKSLVALLSHTRKSSNMHAHIQYAQRTTRLHLLCLEVKVGHNRLRHILIKFQVIATEPTQGWSVCFKDSRNVLHEILANRAWKGWAC